MKPGQASQTAVLVCIGRALSGDPTAEALLPPAARAQVKSARANVKPRNIRARIQREHLRRLAQMMKVRTAAIDEAVRAHETPQLVILGAGLDRRAWRMPELAGTTVFEVDHPDSQRAKRERAAALTRAAKDVRFVAVDFTRDSLDTALAAAGHDPARPTTWIWEGVVMYLAPRDIEATLGMIEQRSAPGSRLVLAYHAPKLFVRALGVYLRAIGEPLRSAYTPDAMRALLARYGFDVVSDGSLVELGPRFGGQPATGFARYIDHLRIAIADRGAGR